MGSIPNGKDLEGSFMDYLTELGYIVNDIQFNAPLEFKGEPIYSARIKVEKEGRVVEGVLLTNLLEGQKFGEYVNGTPFEKIVSMTDKDWGPKKEILKNEAGGFIFVGDYVRGEDGEVITNEHNGEIIIGSELIELAKQNTQTALPNYVQFQIVMERIYGEPNCSLYYLRGCGSKDEEFSIKNITNEIVLNEVTRLERIEKDLGVEIFSRDANGKILDIYQEWIVYESVRRGELLALAGSGSDDYVNDVNRYLGLGCHPDYSASVVVARSAL